MLIRQSLARSIPFFFCLCASVAAQDFGPYPEGSWARIVAELARGEGGDAASGRLVEELRELGESMTLDRAIDMTLQERDQFHDSWSGLISDVESDPDRARGIASDIVVLVETTPTCEVRLVDEGDEGTRLFVEALTEALRRLGNAGSGREAVADRVPAPMALPIVRVSGKTSPDGLLEAWATMESAFSPPENGVPEVLWEQGHEIPLVGPNAPAALHEAAEVLARKVLLAGSEIQREAEAPAEMDDSSEGEEGPGGPDDGLVRWGRLVEEILERNRDLADRAPLGPGAYMYPDGTVERSGGASHSSGIDEALNRLGAEAVSMLPGAGLAYAMMGEDIRGRKLGTGERLYEVGKELMPWGKIVKSLTR